MAENARTPRWWRALPTWIQVLVLTCWLPGVVTHELTHAVVAHWWAQTRFDWDVIGCEHHWQTGHPAPRALTAIAPLLLGSALTVGSLAVLSAEPGIALGAGVWAYLLINLAVFTLASLADIVEFVVAAWAWLTGRRFASTDGDSNVNDY